MKYSALVVFVSLFLLSSCATIVTLEKGGCGTGEGKKICLGKQEIPEKQVDLFKDASQEAIDAVISPQFIEELEYFIDKHSNSGKHSQAWVDFDLGSVQGKLIDEINGLEVETYGGLYGGFYALIFGNKAFDGSEDGPIRLNRWALPRPSASIANTIVHEAAHRIGYSHPHSSKRGMLEVAYCEPPYVIGSIIEKITLGERFRVVNHCHLLSPDS